MDLFSGINLVKYENTKLTLPKVPHEYIQLTFVAENPQLKYDCKLPFEQSRIFESSLHESQILAKFDGIKTVYEFKLNVPHNENDRFEYFPGDTIGILPDNREADVQFIIERLGIGPDCDRTFKLDVLKDTEKKKAAIPDFIPKVYTIRKVLKECLDIRAVPKKLFLRSLAHYTDNEAEKLILNVLSSPEGKSDYDQFIINSKTNIVTLLRQLSTCNPPVTLLLEHLTRLMPRSYSIASSPLQDPTRITIVFSKLNSPEPLTTSYLENIITHHDNNTKIRYYFRKNLKKFHYRNEHLDRNVIMISFGTGIAPFIGFLEHRKLLLAATNKDVNSITWLLTGHRYSERNNLYIDKLKSYQNENNLTELFQAFSRDPESKFKYIQNIIEENRTEFVKLFLDEDTMLYICGDGNRMLPNIKKMIIECLQEVMQVKEKDACDIVKYKIKKFSYLEDNWI